jgi:hypothetical protein
MTTRGHSVSINLRFDVDDRLGVCFEPRNINLYIEVTDAANVTHPQCYFSHLSLTCKQLRLQALLRNVER